ncbi:pleckstrin homology domain-containing family G member 3 isoform X1 [Carassius gibelio]|uniref:pleckstrin homology domain-containing family G member 3 isoform X1 n=1 Tax=Carassius gibelio TaxID=101364 RepID=UPI0022779D7B|nr:pleckstrin homology domain-containing family G member 3 isoform X1 [Carassius gibelio]XP_052386189.1 pleckstrin homology domain-containing family G member 3 isoform X1 [Carassius gibelio]XP_052386190.1 pleckstrin homology domain-containing family G member 3 isoform X1 [Carassius gibelio]XP_052386191.1 pleckstrin homology domain-containing family G member 3 isoform X1 [Carassius gibelio]
MAPSPQLTHVDRVVMEIIETERMYVRDLCSIIEDYLVHIIDTRDLPIKPEQVCSLFGNIEHIYEFNSELLQSLDMCACDPVAIARCFVDKRECFEIYTQYCTNYPNSVAVLTECLRNKSLVKFFRDRQASLKLSLPLGSYLLKPVQRILRYHLLLQEIAKHFDPEEDGYEVVLEAIDSMTGVAWYINDMKRKHEHAVRLQEIQSLLLNWKGPDLTTYGELVLEGTFHVHRAKNERTLFLFDKMLLITKKRGEHYIYKTHISCSTLMLIESAKDSLRFSVTHYKQPKQPHTVQARTVEEKKLWAHHIKRLILENHHAVIPQKAKDAILDMDSTCPVKYRYSPDRLKKAASCQTEDFSAMLKERRRSEPAKRSVRRTKGTLKHADSEGTLLVDQDHLSILSATNVTTVSSNPELKTASPGMIQNGQDRESSTGSLDDIKERRFEEKAKSAEDTIGGDDGEEEDLMGVEQERDGCLENWPLNKSSQTATKEKHDDSTESLSFFGQSSTGERSSQKFFPPFRESEETGVDQSDNYPEMCEPVMAGCHTDPEIVHLNNRGQEIRDNIADCVVFPSPTGLEVKEKEGTQASRNLAEYVPNIEVDVDVEAPCGVFSSPVLDKASNISEQCVSSISQRSSLGVEGSFDLGCPSSWSESRRSSLLSSGAETNEKDKGQEFRQSTPEFIMETIPDSTFLPDQRSEKKQDTLSKKDRLLIHKIQRYYTHAEHQDASFAIKRRESLSYIPAGLVRNLSQQLNDLTDEDLALHKRAFSVTRPTLWSVFNLPGLGDDKKAKDSSDFVVPAYGKESKLRDLSANEEFQPASEMVKVWQDIEVEITGTSEQHQDSQMNFQMTSPGEEKKAETSKVSADSGFGEPPVIWEESDENSTSSPINKIIEKDKLKDFQRLSNEKHKLQERHKVNHPPLPKIISLRSSNEDEVILQDMEKMKNKVFHLARQYSQRIKNSRPVRQRPKISENYFVPKNLSSVMEDRPPGKEKGIPDSPQLLNLNEQDLILDSTPTSPPSSLCSPGSPQFPNCRLYAQRPQSPVQTETFHWPDVKELRSKYNNQRNDVATTSSRPFPVSRSTSFQERALENRSERSRALRSLSCSYSLCNISVQRTTSTDSTCSSKTLEGEGSPSMCRVNAFDFSSGSANAHEQLERGCNAGQYENNLILVERICQVKHEEGDLVTGRENNIEYQLSERANGKEQNFSSWMEKAENGQHSLVKNLRERFQNLSSYT